MTTAREIMTGGAECIGENDTILDAAKRLAGIELGKIRVHVAGVSRA